MAGSSVASCNRETQHFVPPTPPLWRPRGLADLFFVVVYSVDTDGNQTSIPLPVAEESDEKVARAMAAVAESGTCGAPLVEPLKGYVIPVFGHIQAASYADLKRRIESVEFREYADCLRAKAEPS
jgi:hypothetical protein